MRRTRRFDPRRAESDRLRPMFLRWVGKRFNTAALRDAGIPTAHGIDWLGGGVVLDDRWQAIVRELLDASGICPSPCS